MLDYLCDPCKDHFEGVQAHFRAMGISYRVDPGIVRGLDYYTRTAAEVFSGKIGAQSAMFGGGRYDGLAAQLGGKPVPGVGFGMGLERVLRVLEQEQRRAPGRAAAGSLYRDRADPRTRRGPAACTRPRTRSPTGSGGPA